MNNRIKKAIGKAKSKGFFYVFVGQFLTKFIAFFGSVFVVRILSKEQYGYVGYYENLYSYAYIFAGLGLSNAIIRYVVLEKERNSQLGVYKFAIKRVAEYDSVIILLIITVNYFYSHPPGYSEYKYLLVICLLSLPFQDICNCCLYNERAMFSNKRFAIESFSMSVGVIISRVIGAKLYGMSGMLFFQAATYVVFAAFLLLQNHKTYFANLEGCALEKDKRKEIYSYSLQYMITNGLWVVFMLNDVYMLGRYAISAEALAEYKVAYVFPGNMAIISTAIGIVVSPYFVRESSNNEWIIKNLKKTLVIAMALVGSCAVALTLLAKPIIVFLYGEQYVGVVSLMRFMLVAAFLNSSIRYTIANILAAVGKVKYNMISAFAGIVIQVGANTVLIPKVGVYGTVWSNIIAFAIMSILLAIAVYKEFSPNVKS